AAASGELIGGWSGLGIVAGVDGRRLDWDGVAQAATLSGRIELPELRAGRVALRADATALQVSGQRFERARVRADGDVDAHALQLEAAGPALAGRASARGALARTEAGLWRWDGSIDELAVTAPMAIRLEAPARLAADAASVEIVDAALSVDGGAARIASLVL